MIRINLLPVQQEKKRAYGKQQLLLGVLLVLAELGALFYVYSLKKQKLSEATDEANAIEAEVNDLRERNEQINELNAQRDQLQSTARILSELDANRAGPVQVLDEVKLMLNTYANDLQRVSQQRRGWDTGWEPQNLWLSSFVELDGSATLQGRAKSNDDIAEFNIRLASSPYFTGVRLNFTRATSDATHGRVLEFEITATVNYGIIANDDES